MRPFDSVKDRDLHQAATNLPDPAGCLSPVWGRGLSHPPQVCHPAQRASARIDRACVFIPTATIVHPPKGVLASLVAGGCPPATAPNENRRHQMHPKPDAKSLMRVN